MTTATPSRHKAHIPGDILRLVKIAGDDECWLWSSGVTGNGYGEVWFEGKNWSAHRLFYHLVHGRITEGLHVLHQCGTRRCVNPNHLYAGTHAQNMEDRDRHGRTATGLRNGAHTHPERRATAERHWTANPDAEIVRGTQIGTSKLTDGDIQAIRFWAAAGVQQKVLAERFGIAKSHLSRIVRKESWSWL
jgi:hypothetical protein